VSRFDAWTSATPGLEELDGVAGWIFQQNLLAAHPGDDLGLRRATA